MSYLQWWIISEICLWPCRNLMPSLTGTHTLWTALHNKIGIFKVMNEIGFFNNRKEDKRWCVPDIQEGEITEKEVHGVHGMWRKTSERVKMTKVLFSGFIRHITKDMTKMNFCQFLGTQKGLSEWIQFQLSGWFFAFSFSFLKWSRKRNST